MDILNSFMNDTQSIIQSPASGLYNIIRLGLKRNSGGGGGEEFSSLFFKLDSLGFNKTLSFACEDNSNTKPSTGSRLEAM